MARTVTRLQLRTRARQLANLENATNLWPDADVNDCIDRHINECYDLFRMAGPPDYYSSTATITTVVGTTAYALPADFLDCQDLFANETGGRLRPVLPLRRGNMPFFQPPQGVYTLTLEYTPSFTTLSADGSTFDGVGGWDDLIVYLVARDMLIKHRDSEAIAMMNQNITEMRARIRSMSERDNRPKYITDIDESLTYVYPALSQIRAYRIRGANIELYEPIVQYP